MFGTPAYMAPEQIRGQPATGASDIYAFGLVMYETVTGVRPFQGNTPISAAVKRLTEEPLPPRKFCPALNPASEAVILRCLEREPAKRFANAEELVRALAVGAVDIPDLRHTWGRQPRIWLIVAVLLAAAIGIAYRFRIAANHAENTQPTIQARRSVAVLGFKNLSGKPELGWISTALAEELTSELEAGEKLRTIPGENVVLMKSDLSLRETEGLGGDTLARIRRVLGSDLVVSGSYLDVDQQLRVDLRVQDAVAGETVATLTDTATEGQILELVSRVGEALRARCGAGGITAAEAAAVKATQPSSPQVSRLYAQGLDKLRLYDPVSARESLQRAVAADPKYGPAHSALAEAWSRLGYGQKAIQEAGEAVDLSTNLSREEQLSIQGQYRAAKKEWSKAAEIYGELFGALPDNIDYGLRLAAAQTSAGRSQDALATLAALRKLAFPVGDDPRLDLAEAFAADTLGDYKRELEAAKRASKKGEASGGRFVVARALKFEGAALRALGETKLAMAVLEQASSLYTALGDRGGKPLIMIGNILAEQGDFDRAQETFEQALRNARAIGDRATECIALTNIAHVHGDRGDLAAAKPLYIEALGVQREIEDTRNAGSTLSNLGHLLYQVGNYSEGAKTLEESLTIARQVGNRRSEAYVLGFMGELRYAEGNLAESKARSEESLTIAREIGHKRVVESSLSDIGTVLLAQGDFSGAQKYQRDALAVAKEIGENGSAAQYGLALAQISLEKGLPSEAEALAREPLAEFQTEKARGEEALAQTVLVQALLAQNKMAGAKMSMESAAVSAAHTQHYLVRFNVDLANGSVRAVSGQTNAAKTLLRITISRAVAIGCVPCAFEARLALGQVEMKSGKSTAGRGDLEQLEKDATGKGFLLIARKAAAGGRAGVTPPATSSERSQTTQMQ